MRRMTIFSAVFLIGTIASIALGQEVQSTHPLPEDAFSTRELIAWSYLQSPQPAPRPLPLPDAQVPRADQQRTPQSAQLFVGKVVRETGTYTLRASNSVYLLDGEVDSRSENQDVRILGTQDRSDVGTIHVLKIERLR